MPHAAFCTARALQGDLRLLGFDGAENAECVAPNGPARRGALTFLAEAILPGVGADDALAADEALAKFYADAGLTSAALPTAAPAKRGAPTTAKCFAPLNAKPRSARERARASAFLRAAIDLAFAASKRREAHERALRGELAGESGGGQGDDDDSEEADNAQPTATDTPVESTGQDANAEQIEKIQPAEAEKGGGGVQSADIVHPAEADKDKSTPDDASPHDDIDVYGAFTPEDAQLDAELAKLISLRPVLFPLSLRPVPAKRARAPLSDAGNSAARRPPSRSTKPGEPRKAVTSGRPASTARGQPPTRSGPARTGRTASAPRTQPARSGPARTGRTASVVRERPWSRAKKPAAPGVKKAAEGQVESKPAVSKTAESKTVEPKAGESKAGEPKPDPKAPGSVASSGSEKAVAGPATTPRKAPPLPNVPTGELLRKANAGAEQAAADAATLGVIVPAVWGLTEPASTTIPGVSALLESAERATGVVENFCAFADKLESIGEPVADKALSAAIPGAFRSQKEILESARQCATARAAYRELEELVDAPKLPTKVVAYCRERSARASGF